jgi:hypothetical protein
MIFLSATAIKDFLECSKRYYYRRYFKSLAEPSDALNMGIVAHEAIEKYWDNREKAVEYAKMEGMSYNLSAKKVESVQKMVENFHEYFQWLLKPTDSAEQFFKFPFQTGVQLVGKFDRITGDGTLIDWKTSKVTPKVDALSKDPQFILYDWAYERIYGTRPTTTYYASLRTGKLVKYIRDENLENILLNEVIPQILSDIQNDNYVATGVYKWDYPCGNCSFKEACFNELAGRNPASK